MIKFHTIKTETGFKLRLAVWQGRYVGFKLARPNTIWWHKEKGYRNDALFGLIRTFCREDRAYMYKLYIGRLAIVFGNFTSR